MGLLTLFSESQACRLSEYTAASGSCSRPLNGEFTGTLCEAFSVLRSVVVLHGRSRAAARPITGFADGAQD